MNVLVRIFVNLHDYIDANDRKSESGTIEEALF